jgi:hypothetical protein
VEYDSTDEETPPKIVKKVRRSTSKHMLATTDQMTRQMARKEQEESLLKKTRENVKTMKTRKTMKTKKIVKNQKTKRINKTKNFI